MVVTCGDHEESVVVPASSVDVLRSVDLWRIRLSTNLRLEQSSTLKCLDQLFHWHARLDICTDKRHCRLSKSQLRGSLPDLTWIACHLCSDDPMSHALTTQVQQVTLVDGHLDLREDNVTEALSLFWKNRLDIAVLICLTELRLFHHLRRENHQRRSE
jgi:hypothetical protein